MTALFLRWFEFFTRRPLVLAGGVVALLALAVAGATRVHFSEDVLSLLPSGEPVVAQSREALRHFKGLERIVIALEGAETQKVSADVDEAEARLRKLDGVKDVVGRVTDTAQADILDAYAGKTPVLFDPATRAAIESRLTTAEFQRRLQDFVDRQSGAQGIAVADTFRADPFGFDELVFRRFEKLNSGYEARLIGGRLFSKDGRLALILVEADYEATDTGRGREFMPRLETALEDLPGGSRAMVIGAHRSSVDNANVLRSDLNWTIAASVLGIMLLFFLTFRSLTPVLFAVTSAGFGFMVALGLEGWVSVEISAIAAGFAGVLMAISLDCAIHLTASFSSLEGDRPGRARQALAHVAVPSSLAVLTTIVAVATLWLSSFDGLHQLCKMGIAGMLGALLFSLVAGPQVLRRVGPAPRARNVLGRALGLAESARQRWRWPLLGVAVLFTLLMATCLPLVEFDGDVTNLDGKSAATRAAETRIQEAFGPGTLHRTLIVSSGVDMQAALREADFVAHAIHDAGAEFSGPTHVLPSLDTQRENLARWRETFTDARVEEVKQAMAKARAVRPGSGGEIGFDAQTLETRFATFFSALRLRQQPELIDAAVLNKRPLWSLLAGYISESDGRSYVGATAALSPDGLAQLQEKVKSPVTLVVNKAVFVSRMVDLIQRDLALMGGLSLLLVIALVGITFRRLKETLVALVPVLGALLWTLGLMGALGIPFNIINTLLAVFVAGLGIDYGIFFVQTWRDCASSEAAGQRLRVAGTGVLLAALTNLCGFGTLAMAGHPALFSVGITTVLGILASLGLTLFVVPTLLEIGKAR